MNIIWIFDDKLQLGSAFLLNCGESGKNVRVLPKVQLQFGPWAEAMKRHGNRGEYLKTNEPFEVIIANDPAGTSDSSN